MENVAKAPCIKSAYLELIVLTGRRLIAQQLSAVVPLVYGFESVTSGRLLTMQLLIMLWFDLHLDAKGPQSSMKMPNNWLELFL